jgi:glycosyltransferase involved in cell wall biosynthesis
MNPTQDIVESSAGAMHATAPRRQSATQFLVAQIGAKTHYAVPRVLEAEGMLGRFQTDICAVKGWPRLLRMIPPVCRPAGLRSLLGRIPEGVPTRKIRAFSEFGWDYVRRLKAARSPVEQTETYLWAGKRFCEMTLREGLDGVTGVFTFNSAGLELLRMARSQGIPGVMEQSIAPYRMVRRILDEEQSLFPTWELPSQGDARMEEFCAREEAEWQEAKVIVCVSDFVKQTMAACGGPIERCQVVPYGVDTTFTVADRRRHDGPLRVLTMGTVGLRKGAPYVMETARRMQGRATFRMVGLLDVSESAEAELRRAVDLTGPVPRPEVVKHFAWADVFFLPSMCEGSAAVTYEALACGLPVVCTPNTGSVVREGIDGFIVPVRDTEAMADRLEKFHQDRDRLEFASEEARRRASEFTLEAYRTRLMNALHSAGISCEA